MANQNSVTWSLAGAYKLWWSLGVVILALQGAYSIYHAARPSQPGIVPAPAPGVPALAPGAPTSAHGAPAPAPGPSTDVHDEAGQLLSSILSTRYIP